LFRFLWAKELNAEDIHEEIFPVYSGKCLSRKAVHNWVEKFSEGRSKVADGARLGRPVETATGANMQQVEKLIGADRRIKIGSIATALGCSHGLAYSIMHDHLKFRKMCARRVFRELRDREKINGMGLYLQISPGMQMRQKICLTGLLLGTNQGCITTNPIKILLYCNGTIPVHIQPKSWKFKVALSGGKVKLAVFLDSQGVLLANFQKRCENVNSASYCEVLLKLRDAVRRKRPGKLTRGGTASS
jgi:hypothetical protein